MQGPTRKPHVPSFRKPPCTSYFMNNFFLRESTIDRDGNPREFFSIIDFQNKSTVQYMTEYFNEAAK
jgi:hypothetical protein